MDVLIIPVFVSVVLLAAGVVFLLRGVREGDYEHGDRLSLLPLEDDLKPRTPDSSAKPSACGPATMESGGTVTAPSGTDPASGGHSS